MPTQLSPLSPAEQAVAEQNFSLVFRFLRAQRLPVDDWFDVVIFRYRLTVQNWFSRPALYKNTNLAPSPGELWPPLSTTRGRNKAAGSRPSALMTQYRALTVLHGEILSQRTTKTIQFMREEYVK